MNRMIALWIFGAALALSGCDAGVSTGLKSPCFGKSGSDGCYYTRLEDGSMKAAPKGGN